MNAYQPLPNEQRLVLCIRRVMMIFKPVQLGREALDRSVMLADRKSCKRFGPCGVGERALYLSSFYVGCRYYLPYGGITRVFKRVAMSKGGFSHKGVFASIPYLVVEYDGGREKQCVYKYEEQVDQLLACLKQAHPEIRQVSAAAEARLAERERERPPRPELTREALETLKTLKEAEKVLEKRPDLYLELSKSARQKRQLLLTVQRRRGGAVKTREQPILERAALAQGKMERFLGDYAPFPLPARYAHPVVLRRMGRAVEEGRAATVGQALEAVKEGLKALNADVEVSQEEYDEVTAIKSMFLNEDYR